MPALLQDYQIQNVNAFHARFDKVFNPVWGPATTSLGWRCGSQRFARQKS
jgi:hypothetical protein